MLVQTGVTADGRAVFAGIFALYETHGVPLEDIMFGLLQRDALPDWLDLFDRGLASGMKRSNVVRMIQTMAEVVSDEWAAGVMLRLGKHRP